MLRAMAEGARAGARYTPLEEVRERYRAAERAEPGEDRTRYVEALKAFLAAAEEHASEIAKDGPTVAPLLDEAAMAFYRASSPELAERAVDLGLKLSPGASALLHHKALVLLALNRDLPGVLRLVDQALEANPHDKGLWGTRGDALRLMGQQAESVEAYLRAQELDPASTQYVDRALRVSPSDPRALRTKVELARVRSGDASGLEAVDELLKTNPDDLPLKRYRADVLAALGRNDDALAAIAELRKGGDDDPAMRSLEARLLLSAGRTADASPLLEKLVAPNAGTDPATLERIAATAAAALPEVALAARERLRDADPRNVQNLLDLRELAVRLGRTDAALAAGRAVLALTPENLEAMRGIAELQASSGRANDALETYRQIARAHPHAVGEFRKALELARHAALPDACREFAEAILLAEPKDADARLELARGLAGAGDVEGALDEYDALLDAHPGRLDYLLEKRALLTGSHDTAARLKVLDEIFRLDPTRIDVAVERGNLYLASAYELAEQSAERRDAARSALVAYERASGIASARGVSLLGVARASRLVDDPERALKAYTDFLAIDGNAARLDVLKEKAHTLREVGRYAEAAEEYKQAIVGGLEDPDLFWGAAEVFERLNQDALALRYLDLLVRRDPNNALYLRRRAQLLLRAGRRDDALRALQQVVAGAPADPHPYFEAAEVLRAQGAYPDAIDYLRRGLALDPKSRHGLLALAETLLLAGQYPEVITIVDPLLKEDPNDVAAWKARGDAWRALGKPREVLYSLQAILLLEPDNGPALLETFRLRRDSGEKKDAYEALTRLVRSNVSEAQDPTLHLERGDLAASLGLPEEANTAYERAAALDPSLALEIALRRARLRLSAGRPDLALEVLDEALPGSEAHGGPNVAALLLRAEILVALERPTEARTVFEQVRQVEPKSPLALAGIAQATIAEGRPGDAVEFLRGVLPQLPPTEALYLLLAEAEAGLGHLDRAAEALRGGTAALPRSVALFGRLGEIGVAQQEWSDAADAFAHAVALAPSSVDLLVRAGFVAERLNHPNEAVAFYDRATEADPSSKQAWTSRGLALVAAGRAPDGLASFERALALDSDFQPAKDGKKLAQQRMHDTELQKYGREALLLEARLHRTVTKNDLFVLLHVPFEFLDPVLQEITRPPKVDLALVEGTELHDLENASYHLVTAALDRRPPGIERRGFTLADVAVLAPSNYTLPQIQRLFGYLKSVLEADLPVEKLSVTPDVEDLARKAFALPAEQRTLFQLVRQLKVGVYKARVIKAVEESGSSGHRPLPSLDLGAYSPEFRKVDPAPEPHRPKHEPASPETPAADSAPATPSVPVPSAPGNPTAGPASAVKGPPSHPPAGRPNPPEARPSAPAAAETRCVGCGGVAAHHHACGAPLCQACSSRFSKCPKCGGALPPAAAAAQTAAPARRPEHATPPPSHAPAPPRPSEAPASAHGGSDDRTGSKRPRAPEHTNPSPHPPAPVAHEPGSGADHGGGRRPAAPIAPAKVPTGAAPSTPPKPPASPAASGPTPPAPASAPAPEPKPRPKRDDEPRL